MREVLDKAWSHLKLGGLQGTGHRLLQGAALFASGLCQWELEVRRVSGLMVVSVIVTITRSRRSDQPQANPVIAQIFVRLLAPVLCTQSQPPVPLFMRRQGLSPCPCSRCLRVRSLGLVCLSTHNVWVFMLFSFLFFARDTYSGLYALSGSSRQIIGANTKPI